MFGQLLPLSQCPDYGTVNITFLNVDLWVACNPVLMDGISWVATLEQRVCHGCHTRSGIESHTYTPDILVLRHHIEEPLPLVQLRRRVIVLVSPPHYAGHYVFILPPVTAQLMLPPVPATVLSPRLWLFIAPQLHCHK